MLFRLTWVIVLLALGTSFTSAGYNQPERVDKAPSNPAPASLKWIDPGKDAATWTELRNALGEELTPDKSETGSNGKDTMIVVKLDAFSGKRITRYGEAFLVVIEKRPQAGDDWGHLTELYNYNRTRREKSRIATADALWFWEYRQLAVFKDSPIPDIAFLSVGCPGCEGVRALSTLRFDPAAQKWVMRQWPDHKEGVAVESTDDLADSQAVFGITDFDGGGRDEVAVWIVEKATYLEHPEPQLETITLYTFRNGVPERQEVRDPTFEQTIKGRLCRLNAEAKLCKQSASGDGGKR